MTFLLLVLALGLASGLDPNLDLDAEWETYKQTYSKVYSSTEEEQYRRSVWTAHLDFIEQHNQEAARGLHTFTVGVNHFADMTNREFQQQMLGFRPYNGSARGHRYQSGSRLTDLPDAVDWRTKGYVTEVKNQGACGSCWTFSANGALEGQWFRKTGNLVPLSEQNILDCDTEGNFGCDGGYVVLAYYYVYENGGVDTEESYPYEGMQRTCRFDPRYVGATVSGYVEVMPFSELDLQDAVATVGPLSVGMDASHLSFQLYRSGIYYEPECSSIFLDHGVLAVGYGSDGEGQDYWIIKNSWSKAWGEEGYFQLARNRDNHCGVATDATYPTC